MKAISKRPIQKRSDKRASVTIEAAICFSAVLLVLCSMISVIYVYRTDIIMQRSVEQGCEDISSVIPLVMVSDEVISATVNGLPDTFSTPLLNVETFSEVIGVMNCVSDMTAITYEDIAVDVFLNKKLAEDILYEFDQRNPIGSAYIAEGIDVDTEYNEMSHYIEVTVSYFIPTIMGNIGRSVYCVIPCYGDFELSFIGNNEEEEDNAYSIWNEDNFTRGRHFREAYGANLPQTFPCIDGFIGGRALSISSIDLTAPMYENTAQVEQRVVEEIDSLADFDGANVRINGIEYTIDGQEITTRELVIVVPENSPEVSMELVRGLSDYAQSRGVHMAVISDGQSNRYIQSEDDDSNYSDSVEMG